MNIVSALILLQIEVIILFILNVKLGKAEKKSAIIIGILSELICGVFILLMNFQEYDFHIVEYAIVAIITLYVAFVDIKEKIVPDGYVIALAIIGVLSCFLRNDTAVYMPIIAGIITLLILLLLKKIMKGQIGGGDVKIIAAYGLIYGMKDIMSVMFYSLICSLIAGIACMIVKRKTWKFELPFVPFMLAGSLLFNVLKLWS